MTKVTMRGHDKAPNRMSTAGPRGPGAIGGTVRPPNEAAGGNVASGATRMSTSPSGGKGAIGGTNRPANKLSAGGNVPTGATRMSTHGKSGYK